MELDEATRARIRAEETERFKVQAELKAEQRVQERPNYWLGVLLNLLVSGGGLMLLGAWGAGLGWLAAALVLSFGVSPYIGWPVGVLGSFINYNSLYDRLFEKTEQVSSESAHQDRITRTLLLVIGGVLVLGGVLISQRQ